MKKIVALIPAVIMLFVTGVAAFADYRAPVDGIEMESGVNPVVKLLDGNKFEYIIYARDMDGMTNGDFSVYYSEDLSLVSFEETDEYDMCVYNDMGDKINISFMYTESNAEDALKMFILTFSYTGEVEYPEIEVTNIAGTFIKKVAEAVVIDEREEPIASDAEKGDVDFNGDINAADARLALRHASKLETLSEKQLASADVNDDGNVNSADARLILRCSAGLEEL